MQVIVFIYKNQKTKKTRKFFKFCAQLVHKKQLSACFSRWKVSHTHFLCTRQPFLWIVFYDSAQGKLVSKPLETFLEA